MFFVLIDDEFYRELEFSDCVASFDMETNISGYTGWLGTSFEGLPNRAYEVKIVICGDEGFPLINTLKNVVLYPHGSYTSFKAQEIEFFDTPLFVD